MEREKLWIVKNISFKVLFCVFILSGLFWSMFIFIWLNIVYDPNECENTAGRYHTELKIIGVPENLKLVKYDFIKGIRWKEKSRLKLTFAYTLPKKEVLKYYQDNLSRNSWILKEERGEKWIYEKKGYQLILSFLSESELWKIEMNVV